VSDKEGILELQPSGRWALCRPGRRPVEITSGELLRVEVDGEPKPTRMESRHFSGPLGRNTRILAALDQNLDYPGLGHEGNDLRIGRKATNCLLRVGKTVVDADLE
jgi:hypothetical protein